MKALNIINSTLKKYSGEGETVVIPDSVIEIDDSTFEGCKSLVSLTVPDSVTALGDGGR